MGENLCKQCDQQGLNFQKIQKIHINKQEKSNLVHTREPPIRLSVDFSAETWQSRRKWNHLFKVMEENTANQEYSTQKSCPSELKGK